MIAILGAIFGFLGSWAPEVLKLYRDKKDREHELAILMMQKEAQAQGHTERMEEIGAQADIAESQALYKSAAPVGVRWVDALNATVRPLITYSFFGLYAIVKYTQASAAAKVTATSTLEGFSLVWNQEDMAIFCTICAFWFGQRSMKYFFGKK